MTDGISLGEGDPCHQFAERSSCRLEERRGEMVAFQNMARHVAGAEAELQDVGIVRSKLADLG
jgi:hypothetical protein